MKKIKFMMDITCPYYDDNSRISNSHIGWFLKKGPAYLYAMLNGDIEGDKGPQLDRGTMIHEYLLQPEEFYKHYVVWSKCRPSSAQQEKFCQALANTIEIEPNKAVIEAYKEAYSTNNKSEDKILSEGLKIASTLDEYIQLLKECDGRTIITPYQANQLMSLAENIQNHKKAKELLQTPYTISKAITNMPFTEEGELKEALYHEFHINWEYNGILCKSLLDSVYFDFKNKKCILMDLKTTVHIGEFQLSINTYDYTRQLCFYTMAIEWYLENECNENPKDWNYEWYIIGIDTTGLNEIRVFKFEKEQIEDRITIINQALEDIAWHKENNLWEHTKEYYLGDGTESLIL